MALGLINNNGRSDNKIVHVGLMSNKAQATKLSMQGSKANQNSYGKLPYSLEKHDSKPNVLQLPPSEYNWMAQPPSWCSGIGWYALWQRMVIIIAVALRHWALILASLVHMLACCMMFNQHMSSAHAWLLFSCIQHAKRHYINQAAAVFSCT